MSRRLVKALQGFTLVEVMVALGIVAVGLAMGVRATDALIHIAARQSSAHYAQLCSRNLLIEIKLSREVPPEGTFHTSCMQGPMRFDVQVTSSATPNPLFWRVDVRATSEQTGVSSALASVVTRE